MQYIQSFVGSFKRYKNAPISENQKEDIIDAKNQLTEIENEVKKLTKELKTHKQHMNRAKNNQYALQQKYDQLHTHLTSTQDHKELAALEQEVKPIIERMTDDIRYIQDKIICIEFKKDQLIRTRTDVEKRIVHLDPDSVSLDSISVGDRPAEEAPLLSLSGDNNNNNNSSETSTEHHHHHHNHHNQHTEVADMLDMLEGEIVDLSSASSAVIMDSSLSS
eukprot:TRINITY_DN1960_c0_g1_i4.p1 TRINITY_DN1960_c0_g1~~TRINITY_DN1960_c0_g1_i4.p1  ORF type:complete len:220 (+),score=66.41 TRINITY_DN1960_c0_g1_i4:69-728(+)